MAASNTFNYINRKRIHIYISHYHLLILKCNGRKVLLTMPCAIILIYGSTVAKLHVRENEKYVLTYDN